MGISFSEKSSCEILPPIKSAGLVKFGANSKVVKFGFAPYLGGFVRVYMDFRLLWDTTAL